MIMKPKACETEAPAPSVSPLAAPGDIDLPALNERMRSMSASEILKFAIQELFKNQICIVSSFGAESVILLDLIAKIDAELPVIFLNTGKLFGETLRYRDRLQERLGLTDVRAIGPHPNDVKEKDPMGGLWGTNTDACCHIRKVLPQDRAIAGFEAVITGRKRFQTGDRGTMDVLELNPDGKYRLNPLANWDLKQLEAYILDHDLPRHPLVKDGYLSIGCMPCTSRVSNQDGYRSGRWAGTDKDECGIHINVDGDGI